MTAVRCPGAEGARRTMIEPEGREVAHDDHGQRGDAEQERTGHAERVGEQDEALGIGDPPRMGPRELEQIRDRSEIRPQQEGVRRIPPPGSARRRPDTKSRTRPIRRARGVPGNPPRGPCEALWNGDPSRKRSSPAPRVPPGTRRHAGEKPRRPSRAAIGRRAGSPAGPSARVVDRSRPWPWADRMRRTRALRPVVPRSRRPAARNSCRRASAPGPGPAGPRD